MNKIVGLLVIISLGAASCTKYEIPGNMKQPGIVLTFDDYAIDSWYKMMPMLDSFGVKATFYISNYNKITPAQKLKLHEIQTRGHEIGFHTLNHFDLTTYIQKYGLKQLLDKEILEGLRLMRNDGFLPKTFAYPYGSRLPKIDVALWDHFKSLRALNGTHNYSKSCTGSDYNPLMYALVIDEKANKPIELIERMIKSSMDHYNSLVLCAHVYNSSNPRDYSVSDERLRRILKFATHLGMRFYTASEVSPK